MVCVRESKPLEALLSCGPLDPEILGPEAGQKQDPSSSKPLSQTSFPAVRLGQLGGWEKCLARVQMPKNHLLFGQDPQACKERKRDVQKNRSTFSIPVPKT